MADFIGVVCIHRMSRMATRSLRPETKYAKSGDVHIAYQVIGSGPFDLVLTPGALSHLDLAWEEPRNARYFRRMASFCRLIRFDKRGTGLSDRVAGTTTLEERMDDVRAVMDAAGSERAALVGVSEGGPMSILFAATYPDRTTALVLKGSMVSALGDEEIYWRPQASEEQIRQYLDQLHYDYDDETMLQQFALLAPSAAHDERAQDWFLRLQRAAASPSALRALTEMNVQIDVRSVLPSIRVPTLVIQVAGDRITPVEDGRYLAEHIPGAKYAELPGQDHMTPFGDTEAVVGEIEEFLTGVRPAPDPERVLATVLFTDIVGSTGRAAELGDRRWREVLDEHDDLVRNELARFRGKEIGTAGDGFLATFDGPARGIRCALSLANLLGSLAISIRAGLHTGEVELRDEDVGGIAVHIGARVAAVAGPGEVLVSRTVKDLVAGSGLEFEDRGVHALKGLPEEWQLYAVKNES